MEPCHLCGELVWTLRACYALCGDCAGVLDTLVVMQEPRHWGAPDVVPRRDRGRSVENLLQRIMAHPLYAQLARSRREELAQIGRFDRRRDKLDNDYVRTTYDYLMAQGEQRAFMQQTVQSCQ